MEEVDCTLPVTKTTTEPSDACTTEDAIRALFVYLVDPLLPFKSFDVPSKPLRESVAKQVHAVVLLFNYYHRRDNPHLECLSFESFSSLATDMRPALLLHLKEDSSGRDGDLDHTVLLEKVIKDACSLSMSLDASSDLLVLNKFPIRTVAVLLVDSEKKNCYLKHSSITQGVWSLLENPIIADQKQEVVFQKVAFAAVKEATGVNHKDIVILERHLVCSLSEEKTAVRFYIMKCTSQDKFSGENPVEEMLSCMQGPLFEKSFSEWSTNSRVEYFHVLPYASLIQDWFSRRGDTESLIEKESEAVCDDRESNGNEDATNELELSDIFGRGGNAASRRRNEIKAKKVAALLSNPKARRKATPGIHNRYFKGSMKSYVDTSNGGKGGLEVASDQNDHKERGIQRKKAVTDRFNSIHKLHVAPVSAHNSNQNLEDLQTSLLSRATSLSETALKVLLCKRDKLTRQQRYVEDEIAKCDKRIQNIKGDWELQLETILECCNETYPSRTLQESSDKSACQSNKRLKLSESLPTTKSLCQRLDDICLMNNWVLPNYRVSPSDGGYEAEVRIKGNHVAYTVHGEEKSDAEEARESAAACLLTKLQNTTANLS
ncbi:PREDICTED: uncharacterized protein LOC104754750 [Camelina sativa]|uniref:Uncharacterized protein LOC104754750 n=1 Tax=Camelina sativa TaxID=90675 RepID=A0ABM0WRZ4_CAMSA|nr:PREDICTED: uncharacterized protein LOC104754750 [Camelina sativa]